jgi:organic hydroperoxide reductase OsmC/OhrA
VRTASCLRVGRDCPIVRILPSTCLAVDRASEIAAHASPGTSLRPPPLASTRRSTHNWTGQGGSTRAHMTIEDIAAAVRRVESVLQRRPASAIHDDAPATAKWQTGLRVMACHADGTQIVTDMPSELGGSGAEVTPGWLFRAGLASCLATRIAIGAATDGIELTLLEVSACSRSDARGLFGMPDISGAPVGAGPRDVQLFIRIAAPGVSAEKLQALVEDSNRCSPVSAAARDVVPVALRIEVAAA